MKRTPKGVFYCLINRYKSERFGNNTKEEAYAQGAESDDGNIQSERRKRGKFCG